MKKKLSILLVATMALSMVPTSVFASSDNKTTSKKIVKADKENLEMGSLVLEPKDSRVGGQIILNLENAKWDETFWGTGSTEAPYTGSMSYVTAYSRISETQLMINLDALPDTTKDWRIPMLVKSGSTGDMKVTVDPRGTELSAGTYTFGVVAGGATNTTVSKVKDIVPGDTTELDTIVIDETTIAGKDIDEIKLMAPAGFDFVNTSNIKVTGLAGYTNTTYTPTVTFENSDDLGNLKLTFPIFKSNSTTGRGMIKVTGVALRADRDANLGDVVVTTKGDLTEQDIVMAKCVDYKYGVTAATPKDLIAGDKDSEKVATITIKEDAIDSWWMDRRDLNISFPEGVKVVDIDGAKMNGTDIKSTVKANAKYDTKDYSEVSISGLKRTKTDEAAKFEITFKVNVAADFTGDVVATVDGSVDKAEVTVAKVKAPIALDFKTTDVSIAKQDLTTSEIKITEAKAGALQLTGDKKLKLRIDSNDRINFTKQTKVDYEVTEGNVQIDKVSVDSNGYLIVEVKRESTKPSTIVLKGLDITVDRTPAEGKYSLEATGNAIVANYDKDEKNAAGEKKWFDSESIEFENYINVTTTVTGSTNNKVAIAIGNKTYKVNGVEKTLDVAPVQQNDRTLVPTRAISEGLGFQVLWNDATQTATVVTPDNRTAAFTLGSKVVTVNGQPSLTMDVAPTLVEDRMLVPFRALGDALGINVTWDEATKTATFN